MKYLVPRALLLSLFLGLHVLCFSQTPDTSGADVLPPELNPKAWKQYSSVVGGYSALFPATPAEDTQPAPPPAENVLMHLSIASTMAEYGVSYADFPWPIESTDRVTSFLAGVRDGGVKGMNGRLLADREESFAGHPGRLYKVEFSGGYIITSRTFVVKNRLYMVTATTYGENAPPEIARIYEAAADKFFSSFQLLAGQNQIPATETETEGEVDRLLRELKEKGAPVLGRCLEGSQCQPLKGQMIDGRVAKGEVTAGQILNKPQPIYSPIAKAARVIGAVAVQVVVDEEGKVIAAQAVSGHPLLQAAALQAAREASFTPTLLDGKPVKVSGVITYNFVLQ